MLKIHFRVVLFGLFWSVKYLSFGQKLPIWTAHHTFLESIHLEVTKNPYYVLFGLISRIHPFIFPCTFKGFISSESLNFFPKPVYSTMVVEKFQIYSVKITDKYFCETKN